MKFLLLKYYTNRCKSCQSCLQLLSGRAIKWALFWELQDTISTALMCAAGQITTMMLKTLYNFTTLYNSLYVTRKPYGVLLQCEFDHFLFYSFNEIFTNIPIFLYLNSSTE